jgi:hypothetical protein
MKVSFRFDQASSQENAVAEKIAAKAFESRHRLAREIEGRARGGVHRQKDWCRF